MPSKKKNAPKKSAAAKKKAAPAAGKRSAAKKAAPEPSAARDELLALLPELDEEGIAFLLEQAKVHRYNMEVEKLNTLSSRLESGEGGRSGAGSAVSNAAAPEALRIERSADGSTYNLVAGGDWKMFTAEEMAALVCMTRSGESEAELARRLRAWFARERRDIYLELGLDGPSIGMAVDIVRLLRKTFPGQSAK